MHVFSRTEWEALRATIDPRKATSLGEYAVQVNRTNARWRQRYPGVNFSNARYAAHLERALEAGADVPIEYIASVTDDDLRFDGYCFPLLNAARAKTPAGTTA